jgi:glycosyltransferase involved in cell wall biosynthesis
MVVKNERNKIGSCLSGIHDLFDQITVVDTGSTDGTPEHLQNEFGADVIHTNAPAADPQAITDARNLSLKRNPCDWILVLDADEQVAREDVIKIKHLTSGPGGAHFLTWRNTRHGEVFDDYKLALFKNNPGISYEGMVHCNPTRSFRKLGISATLAPDIVINHSLEQITGFRSSRKERLERHVREDPTWWRYQWFLGYTYFKENDFERAVPLLRDTCNSLSKEFPVECLNAHLVLTDINARKGIHDKCYRIMKQATSFFEEVKDDFEVKANKQMGTWIAEAVKHINQHQLEKVRSYEFAY